MRSLGLFGGTLLALAASPALAQAGGGGTPPGGGGSATGGGAADRVAIPSQSAGPHGANAQDAIDRQGDLSRNFAPGAKRAQAYRTQLEQFADQSADRRSQALALREDALAGKPLPLSSKEIRDLLQQDMEDWRKAFKIGRQDYEGLRDEILVPEDALTPAQWADRRAQWFELRDQWIAQQIEAAKAQGG